MSNDKKHINLFDELLRVLSLKKTSDVDIMDSTLSSIDLSYIPDKEKSDKLIHDLEKYYNRIKPKKKFPRYLPILILGGLVPLAILYFKANNNKIDTKTDENTKTELTKHEESKPFTPEDTSVLEIKRPKKEIKYTIDKTILIKPDTIHKITYEYETDTIYKTVIISDTIIENTNNKLNSNNLDYCDLPKKYKFYFNNNSVLLNDKYDKKITELSEIIAHCQHLEYIKIIGYYKQKFIFFNTKELASKRINSIIENIEKHNISSRTLKKTDKEFIHFKETGNPKYKDAIVISLSD